MIARLFALLFVVAAALFGAPPFASAEPFRTENVETELHSARASIAPGETFWVVLRQDIREDWHTYWRNPGDSGEPTEITWRLPAGFSAGETQWPIPDAIPFAILVNYGYSNEVLFPIQITAPANLQPGQSVQLNADLYWLVCSDVCIPEQGAVTLTLPVSAAGADDPEWAARIEAAVAALPQQANVEARVTAGTPVGLSVALPSGGDVRNPYFFPFSRDAINHAASQNPRSGDAGVSFGLEPGVAEDFGRAPLEGIVAFEQQEGGTWVRRAYQINASPGPALAGTSDRAATVTGADGETVAPAGSDVALPLVLLFAFLGGLILNVMPCVLPVLSIKALSFAGGAHSGEAKRHGVFYLVGVLATFLALAGVLAALRAGGEAVGWGFQLQSPPITAGLALLFFVIGLNLLSVFEIGGSVQDAGSSLTQRGGDAGAFFTGALAVIAATPCTAPFMATAMGATLTQSVWLGFLVFLFLGLGFALPMVALAFAPALQRLIPKPGAWMDEFKRALAFPMFGAAVWLVWVFTEQTGPMGALAILSIAVALSFALVVAKWGRVWLVLALLVLAGTAFAAWRPIAGAPAAEELAAEPWSEAAVAAAQADGRPVFVNFTAAWCVTCKVNEGIAFTPRVRQELADSNVAYLVGDWTNRDDVIAAELASHGRAGVPLYLYYPAEGGPPEILPQLLTESLVLDTISGGGE